MTPQKVSDILIRIIDEDWHVYTDDTDDAIEALKYAAKVVEKEIPKKPIEKCIENGNIEEFKKNLLRAINAGIFATNTKDDYSRGIRNGMRWCRSLLDDKEPQYELKVVDKEIPKKPIEKRIENGDQTQIFDVCPFCGSPEIDQECGDYCPNCGQKIDWEEKDGDDKY